MCFLTLSRKRRNLSFCLFLKAASLSFNKTFKDNLIQGGSFERTRTVVNGKKESKRFTRHWRKIWQESLVSLTLLTKASQSYWLTESQKRRAANLENLRVLTLEKFTEWLQEGSQRTQQWSDRPTGGNIWGSVLSSTLVNNWSRILSPLVGKVTRGNIGFQRVVAQFRKWYAVQLQPSSKTSWRIFQDYRNGPLPTKRVAKSPPFTHTGIDSLGPVALLMITRLKP